MSTLYYGSLCISDLIDQLKQKHSAFSKAQNGKIYVNVNVWLNDQKDKFGNIMAVQINPSKEMKDIQKKLYIGNLKESEGKPVSDRDISGIDDGISDVPYRERRTDTPTSNVTEPIDDLPF